MWRVSDGTLLVEFNRMGIGINHIQFSSDGAQFAAGMSDATVALVRNPIRQPGDVNGDGCVDDSDLLRVLSAFGNLGGPEDLDGDGSPMSFHNPTAIDVAMPAGLYMCVTGVCGGARSAAIPHTLPISSQRQLPWNQASAQESRSAIRPGSFP